MRPRLFSGTVGAHFPVSSLSTLSTPLYNKRVLAHLFHLGFSTPGVSAHISAMFAQYDARTHQRRTVESLRVRTKSGASQTQSTTFAMAQVTLGSGGAFNSKLYSTGTLMCMGARISAQGLIVRAYMYPSNGKTLLAAWLPHTGLRCGMDRTLRARGLPRLDRTVRPRWRGCSLGSPPFPPFFLAHPLLITVRFEDRFSGTGCATKLTLQAARTGAFVDDVLVACCAPAAAAPLAKTCALGSVARSWCNPGDDKGKCQTRRQEGG